MEATTDLTEMVTMAAAHFSVMNRAANFEAAEAASAEAAALVMKRQLSNLPHLTSSAC